MGAAFIIGFTYTFACICINYGGGHGKLLQYSCLENPEMQETWVRSLGQEDPLEKGNPLQYSCLENSMDRGAWWATVHGFTKSQTLLK